MTELAIHLLVEHQPRMRVDALQRQVEELVVVRVDTVVVDRRADAFRGPWFQRAQHQRRSARRQADHRAARVVCDAYDVKITTAVIEELLYRRSEAGTRPAIAEAAAEFSEGVNENRRVQGAAKCTSDKGRRGFGRCVDGLIHRRNLCDRDATIDRI